MQNPTKDSLKRVQDAVVHALNETRDQVSEVHDRVMDASEEARLAAKKVAKRADREVRENPWAFIGLAALASVIIGFLLGRRSKD